MISTVLFHNRFLSLFMKGVEILHSSLFVLHLIGGGERNRTSLPPNFTWQLSPCDLPPSASGLPGTLPGTCPSFRAVILGPFVLNAISILLSVVSCHHAAISKKFCPNWVAITMLFPNLGLAPMLMNHCLTWQTLTFSISATPSEVMSSFR